MIYEMVAGRPPWAYKTPVGAPLDAYFASVTALATDLQTESLTNDAARWSPALQSLLRCVWHTCATLSIACAGTTYAVALDHVCD